MMKTRTMVEKERPKANPNEARAKSVRSCVVTASLSGRRRSVPRLTLGDGTPPVWDWVGGAKVVVDSRLLWATLPVVVRDVWCVVVRCAWTLLLWRRSRRLRHAGSAAGPLASVTKWEDGLEAYS